MCVNKTTMSAPTLQQILSHELRTGTKNIAMRRAYNNSRKTISSNPKPLTTGGKKKKKKSTTPMKKNEFYNVHTRQRETVDAHRIRVVETKNGRYQAVAKDSRGREMRKFVSKDF